MGVFRRVVRLGGVVRQTHQPTAQNGQLPGVPGGAVCGVWRVISRVVSVCSMLAEIRQRIEIGAYSNVAPRDDDNTYNAVGNGPPTTGKPEHQPSDVDQRHFSLDATIHHGLKWVF